MVAGVCVCVCVCVAVAVIPSAAECAQGLIAVCMETSVISEAIGTRCRLTTTSSPRFYSHACRHGDGRTPPLFPPLFPQEQRRELLARRERSGEAEMEERERGRDEGGREGA